MFKRISVSTSGNLIRERNPLIFDVRDTASYETAHLPNAVYLSDQTLKTTIKKGKRDRPILVYCYHGNASQDIAKLFCDFGFSDVYSMDGGFESWHREMPEGLLSPALPKADLDSSLSTWLSAQGFDPTNVESRALGVTPLIKACQLGRADIVAALIRVGAGLDGVDDYGNDALWAACFSGDLPTLTVLKDAGADLNRINPNGSSCLMYAASAGKTSVVEFLLQAGANPRLENQDGFTALDLGTNLEILRLLKPHR